MEEPTPFDEDDDWTNKDLIEKYYRYGIQPDWLAIHRVMNHRYILIYSIANFWKFGKGKGA